MIPTTTSLNLDPDKPVLLVITGPTASGKTDYAIQLAKYFNTEIISADSRQIFKEISIGTAKPSAEQLAEIPHHFIDHCSIVDEYNAGIYEKEVLNCLDMLFEKHKIVILVGGTGLYIKAVCQGLDDLPKANPELRKQLEADLKESGIQVLKDKLLALDPMSYLSVDTNNPNRLMRAIELIRETGKPLSELKTNTQKERPFNMLNIYMDIPRDILYQRINSRVDVMMDEGLLEEARSVYPKRNLNALQTVGYNEVFAYFDGHYSKDEMINKIKQHTRNYAKRQITWFKSGAESVAHYNFDQTELEKFLR